MEDDEFCRELCIENAISLILNLVNCKEDAMGRWTNACMTILLACYQTEPKSMMKIFCVKNMANSIKVMVQDIPMRKSFQAQALTIELIYRLWKGKGTKQQGTCIKDFIKKLPCELAHGLQCILPVVRTINWF